MSISSARSPPATQTWGLVKANEGQVASLLEVTVTQSRAPEPPGWPLPVAGTSLEMLIINYH